MMNFVASHNSFSALVKLLTQQLGEKLSIICELSVYSKRQKKTYFVTKIVKRRNVVKISPRSTRFKKIEPTEAEIKL
jgi:hypothetical protein